MSRIRLSKTVLQAASSNGSHNMACCLVMGKSIVTILVAATKVMDM